MKHIRIYTDANGVSHFEDVPVTVYPKDFAPPAPPLNLADSIDSRQIIFCVLDPGWFGDWHPTPCRQFYIQLAGELEIEVSDGEKRRISAGDVVLLHDTSGDGHVSRVIGESQVHAVFVQLANED